MAQRVTAYGKGTHVKSTRHGPCDTDCPNGGGGELDEFRALHTIGIPRGAWIAVQHVARRKDAAVVLDARGPAAREGPGRAAVDGKIGRSMAKRLLAGDPLYGRDAPLQFAGKFVGRQPVDEAMIVAMHADLVARRRRSVRSALDGGRPHSPARRRSPCTLLIAQDAPADCRSPVRPGSRSSASVRPADWCWSGPETNLPDRR